MDKKQGDLQPTLLGVAQIKLSTATAKKYASMRMLERFLQR